MGKIIAVMNNKGGVGKTAVSVNLSHALALFGKRVLVIDMDSQCNCTDFFVPQSAQENSILDLWMGEDDVSSMVYPTTYPNLHCLPNTEDCARYELEVSKEKRFYRLQEIIRPYAIEHFDYTLIDCPPNLGIYVLAALLASDFILVPILAGSQKSFKGIGTALEFMNSVSEEFGHPLKFLRLLVNKVDRRTSISRAIIDLVKKTYGEDLVFKTVIPASTAFEQAEADNTTVLRGYSSTVGAKQYKKLAEELIFILGVE